MNTRSNESLDSIMFLAQTRLNKLGGNLQLLRSCVTAFSYASELSEGDGDKPLYWPDLMEIIGTLIPKNEVLEELEQVIPQVKDFFSGLENIEPQLQRGTPLPRRAARRTDSNSSIASELASEGRIPVSATSEAKAVFNGGGK